MTDTRPDALDKRIKRRVTARERTFFVSVSPGLMDICMKEITNLFPDNREIQTVEGGIEFNGKVSDCYLANLHLRTASRILMRLGSFKATTFQELEKQIGRFPWELYLKNGTPDQIHVSLAKSKLYHDDAVAERFGKFIAAYFDQLAETSPSFNRPSRKKQKGQSLYIRAVNDRFTISIDSSGELLYKRGIKKHGGKAPMRETIAAAALMASGYDGRMPLIDPMCGSGTFSFEAAMMALNIPSGWYRTFAFTGWPCFRDGTWQHILREAEKDMFQRTWNPVFASDLDETALSALRETIEGTELSNTIRISEGDFFGLDPTSLTEKKGLVIINPPYGLRIGKSHETVELVPRIIDQFKESYKGWRVAVVSTRQISSQKLPRGFKTTPFFHGGLNLFLISGRVR